MYQDVFIEEIVRRKSTTMSVMIKLTIILAAAFLSVLTFLFVPYIAPLLFAIICVAAYMLFRNQSIEYEYSFTNGDLDVDRITAKRWRKRMMETNCQKILVMAPYTPEFESEAMNHQVSKRLDFSSSSRAAGRWFLILENNEGTKTFAVLEPSERLLDGMKGFLRSKMKREKDM